MEKSQLSQKHELWLQGQISSEEFFRWCEAEAMISNVKSVLALFASEFEPIEAIALHYAFKRFVEINSNLQEWVRQAYSQALIDYGSNS